MAEKVETKRVKISKAQRLTLVEVLGASLILGSCVVISSFMLKYIGFNAKVLTAKDEAISEYDQTLRNVGICEDKDRNGRLNDAELTACRPNQISLEKVPNSLRYNVYEVMSKNPDLELVARKRGDTVCYKEDGVTLRDFMSEYETAINDSEREQAMRGMKLCSSLRVISDALPDRKNTEALMASLNALFLVAKIDEPDSLAPRDGVVIESDILDLGIIPVTFSMTGQGSEVIKLLDSVERSIREVDIQTGTFEWTAGEKIKFTAMANAYYLDQEIDLETTKTVRPDK